MMATSIFQMPSSSRVLLLSALFPLINALPWSGPDPTASYRPADWNPRPTAVPRPVTGLIKRDDDNASVCGWIGGDVFQPAACASDEKCVYDTAHGIVGCCPLSGPCTTGVFTGCVEESQWRAGLNPSVLTCSGSAVCYQNTYPGGYFQYGCGVSSDAASIATTYTGQNSAFVLPIAYSALSLASTVPSSSSLTSSSSSSPSSSSTSSSISSSSSSTSSTFSSSVSSSSKSSMSSQTIEAATASTTVIAPSSVAFDGQRAATTTAASITSSEDGSQANVGIIAGSVVGGLAVVFSVLALGCGLMVRRKRRRSEEEARAIGIEKDRMSMSSCTLSHSTNRTEVPTEVPSEVYPFSPDDIVSPISEFLPPPKAVLQPSPPLAPHLDLLPVIETTPQLRRIELVDAPLSDSDSDSSALPPPWVRAPTPPPRSPKRLQPRSSLPASLPAASFAPRTTVPELHFSAPSPIAPIEAYLTSAHPPTTALRPSHSTASNASNTSDTSHYSRTTDGRSYHETSYRPTIRPGEKIPPMPIIRKPVGTGWYRSPALLLRRDSTDHVAFRLAEARETASPHREELVSPPSPSPAPVVESRSRSVSMPIPLPPSTASNDGDTERENHQGLRSSVGAAPRRPFDTRGVESDLVAPLRLRLSISSPVNVVEKKGRSLVPILGVPTAPAKGVRRERRLYDV